MKKLLIGLLVLFSFSSFAGWDSKHTANIQSCTFNLGFNFVNAEQTTTPIVFSSDVIDSAVYRGASCPVRMSVSENRMELICNLVTITKNRCNYKCDSTGLDYRMKCLRNN